MFKIQVVNGGPETYHALTYGEKHPGSIQFLQSQFSNVSNMLDNASSSFMDGMRNVYERFNGSEAMRAARRVLQKVEHAFDLNNIRPLWEMADMQNAGTVMQRWMMAEPTIREMYHQQRCDGFSDTYVDMQPGMVGDLHYDYRRVMNGMLQDDEHDWKCETYFDELHVGDRELTLDEQADILSTWDLIRMHAKRGKEDPTSQFGSSL